jgi:hypothetical protein
MVNEQLPWSVPFNWQEPSSFAWRTRLRRFEFQNLRPSAKSAENCFLAFLGVFVPWWGFAHKSQNGSQQGLWAIRETRANRDLDSIPAQANAWAMLSFTAILLVTVGGFWYWLGFTDTKGDAPKRLTACLIARIVGVLTAIVGVSGWVYLALHNMPNWGRRCSAASRIEPIPDFPAKIATQRDDQHDGYH